MNLFLPAMLLSILSGTVQDGQESDMVEAALEPAVEQDLLVVELAPEFRDLIASAPGRTRLLLHLMDDGLEEVGAPMNGPSPFQMQPIASWSLGSETIRFMPDGDELRAGAPDLAHPASPSTFDGRFRAQVVVDFLDDDPGPGGRGDLHGPVVTVDLDRYRRDILVLQIDRTTPLPVATTPRRHLVKVERTSRFLPDRDDAPGIQRAWVVLPQGYHDIEHDRRFWPTIFLVPEEEAAGRVAEHIANLTERREVVNLLPKTIWVVLDPIGTHGHHHFIDSQVNGSPRRALVEELIPWLNIRFRTIAEPRARILFGEGAGARAALGLFADHEELFGKVWAISPNALGFDHLGVLDLYRMQNAFVNDDGRSRPAVRTPLGSERDLIHRTVRDEVMIANTLGPNGRSGTGWDAWRATFGRLGIGDPFPPWPFDLTTGSIDKLVAADWSQKDFLIQVRRNSGLAERLRRDARVVTGARNEWYGDGGVAALASILGIDPDLPESPVHVKPEQTSETTSPLGRMNAYGEIIKYLSDEGLQD